MCEFQEAYVSREIRDFLPLLKIQERGLIMRKKTCPMVLCPQIILILSSREQDIKASSHFINSIKGANSSLSQVGTHPTS